MLDAAAPERRTPAGFLAEQGDPAVTPISWASGSNALVLAGSFEPLCDTIKPRPMGLGAAGSLVAVQPSSDTDLMPLACYSEPTTRDPQLGEVVGEEEPIGAQGCAPGALTLLE